MFCGVTGNRSVGGRWQHRKQLGPSPLGGRFRKASVLFGITPKQLTPFPFQIRALMAVGRMELRNPVRRTVMGPERDNARQRRKVPSGIEKRPNSRLKPARLIGVQPMPGIGQLGEACFGKKLLDNRAMLPCDIIAVSPA